MKNNLINILCPPFDADRKLKADIAAYFFSDAHYYLRRSKLVYDNPTAFEPFSTVEIKNFVDMLFTSECSLKSLIMSLSPQSESPENAYKKLRDCGHKLELLINEVKKSAKNRLKFLNQNEIEFLTNANDIGIGKRYSLEFYLSLRGETFKERTSYSGKYSQWLSREKLKKFIEVNELLLNIADNSFKRYCNNSRNYTMDNSDKYMTRLKNFEDNWKPKKQKN